MILVAPRRVRKTIYSIEVGTSEVRVLTFGLSPIIKSDIRHPRKNEDRQANDSLGVHHRFLVQRLSWVFTTGAKERKKEGNELLLSWAAAVRILQTLEPQYPRNLTIIQDLTYEAERPFNLDSPRHGHRACPRLSAALVARSIQKRRGSESV